MRVIAGHLHNGVRPGVHVHARQEGGVPPSDLAMDGNVAGEDPPAGGERLEQWQVEAFVARRHAGCRRASH